MYFLLIDGFAIIIAAALLGSDLARHRHRERIYSYCLAIFALGMIGMLIGTFPFLLPPAVTIFDAASPDNTLRFMLYGIGPLLPIILAYNVYVYRIFRHDSFGEESRY
jgi:cytochrome d ubiquinol oxidase subunit II